MSKFSMKTVAVATVIGGMIASAVSASAALNLPAQNCSYMFNTNMKLGSSGTDVMNLQKVLNMYPQTQVSVSGAGSPGMETSYFGPATRAAANKLQALHLVELGITAPTGNVFAGTRGILNQLCGGSTGNTGNTGGSFPLGCTSAVGFSPITGMSCATGNTGNTGNTQSGPVSVMLSASQPTGMLVQSQAGALLANLTFTGNGTVTSIELQRVGVSTDSSLTNVYLYDGNVRITDAASVVTGGYIRFNAGSGLFTVSGSRTISVRADISATAQNQSVGVKLNSVTAMGGSPSTYSNVQGNVLLVGSATTAGVVFAAMSPVAANVDAGTQNYNVWSDTVSISTRDVSLRAMTFKFVGSAPVDSMANLSLYIDGTKVAGPSMINAANNNKLAFDLGSMPFLMKTGSHTIDVRGDIVKGSFRTIQMSIENVADVMMEDTSLTGVNVSASYVVLGTPITQGTTAYNTITVNKGSVTVSVDPSFNPSTVTGGATNVPVGQFTMKGYGEDVKVNNLKVNFIATGNGSTGTSTLNNVSLYVNGGQVGTSQNFTGAAASSTGLTYTLGSSLIIPAGQTVTLTVKADIVDVTNAAYTSGSITAQVGGVASNAQGQSSNELVSVASSVATGNTLTISSGAGTFARTAGFTAVSVSPNTNGVKIGSFTISANSSESIKVNSIGVSPVVTTYGITNLSTLTLKTGSTVLGTPVGNPSTGTTTFSFPDIIVPANGTQTFDVYADIGSATSGSVQADMTVTYRGSVSNNTTSDKATGIAITSAVASLGTPTLVSSSPVSQFVVGGTASYGIATFKLSTAAVGTTANVTELEFTTTGTDAITSITVNGVTRSVNGAGTTTIPGLNITVPFVGVDVPVTVAFSGFQGSTSGGSLTTGVSPVSVSLGRVKATSGSGAVIYSIIPVASNNMSLVASKPTVTVGAGNTDTLVLGAENKVGEFTVAADANGKIAVASSSFVVSSVGISNIQISNARVADGNTTMANSSVIGSSTLGVIFSTAYEIAAGQSKTFSIFATVAGAVTSGFSGTPYITSSFASSTSFRWVDVIGGGTQQTGATIYNFPTSSFTSKR